MTSRPWYREPWPWLLMAGPAAVVVAGAITTAIAIRSSDGVVADDYYKQGLAINRTLAREARAEALHLQAQVQFNEERTRVRVRLSGEASPARIRLTLVHPTRAGGDQAVVAAHSGGGIYDAAIAPPHAGTWRVKLEDGDGGWKLSGAWRTRDGAVTLVPQR